MFCFMWTAWMHTESIILDKQVVKAITDSFGIDIWHKALVVLTHAQLLPLDALSYEEFFFKRSESLLKCVRQGARISKTDAQSLAILVALVENSGRCNKNESDEKILPTGTPWIPNLVHMIIDMALNGADGVLVDKKLIEGPNANDRGKIFIPVILVLQYLFARVQYLKKSGPREEPSHSKAVESVEYGSHVCSSFCATCSSNLEG